MAAKSVASSVENSSGKDDEKVEELENNKELQGERIYYDVEHLATFSTASSQQQIKSIVAGKRAAGGNKSPTTIANNSIELGPGIREPKLALERLFDMEKLSGIWTQRMQIELRDELMLIVDCETNSVVERFHKNRVKTPEAFEQYNDIYNNIIVFIIDQRASGQEATDERARKSESLEEKKEDCRTGSSEHHEGGEHQQFGELHIFQCVSHKAQQLVAHILAWQNGKAPDISADKKVNHDDLNGVKPSSKTRGENGNEKEGNHDDDEAQLGEGSSSLLGNSSGRAKQEPEKVDQKVDKLEGRQESVGEKVPAEHEQQENKQPKKDKINLATTSSGSSGGSSNKPPVVVTAAASKTPNGMGDNAPIVNVNVKETVQVFNQIAALREKGNASSPTNNVRPLSDCSLGSTVATGGAPGGLANGASASLEAAPQQHQQQQNKSDRLPGSTQLGQGAQLYQQRSIRATLAPTSHVSDHRPAEGQQARSGRQSKTESGARGKAEQQPLEDSSCGSCASCGSCSSSSCCSLRAAPEAHSLPAAAGKVASSAQQLESALLRNGRHRHQQRQQQQQQQAGGKLKHTKHSQASRQADLMEPAGAADSASSGARSRDRHRQENGASAARLGQQLAHNQLKHSGQATGAAGSKGAARNMKAPLPPPPPLQNAREEANSPPMLDQQQLADQVATNESYVSVLNHCFDDIEKFIIRLQQAFSAMRELHHQQRQSKQHRRSSQSQSQSQSHSQSQAHTKTRSSAANGGSGATSASSSSGSSTNSANLGRLGPGASSAFASNNKQQHPKQQPLPPLPPIVQGAGSALVSLVQQSQGPSGEDYFEILSKFKLAFNLLAKLKGCIHEPNAPELVHFLFTPLAIIIESARNVSPPVDPTLVGIPYLNRDALELLSNCCTSKESDLWHSLGPNWTQTIDVSLLRAARLPSSFQPIFSDGWAPVINELELIGLPSARASAELVAAGRPFSPPPLQRATALGPSLELEHEPELERELDHEQYLARRTSRLAGRSGALDAHAHADGEGARRQSVPLGAGARVEAALASGPHQGRGKRQPAGNPLPADAQAHARASRAASSSSGGPRHAPPTSRADPAHPLGHYHSQAALELLAGADLAAGSFNSTTFSDDCTLEMDEPMLMSQAAKRDQLKAMRNFRSNEHMLQAGGGATSAAAHYQQRAAFGLPVVPKQLAGGRHLLAAGEQRHKARQLASRKGRSGAGYALEEHYLDSTQLQGPMQNCYLLARDMPPGQLEHQMQGGDHEDQLEQETEEELRRAMLLDLGPAQMEWLYELQAREALVVRVLFSREANNDKELSVRRGELLEILDDSRKWWKARNIELQVGHVPHTIVAIMDQYQTLDELLANTNQGDMLLAGCTESTSGSSRGHTSMATSSAHSQRLLPQTNDARWLAERRAAELVEEPLRMDAHGMKMMMKSSAQEQRRASKASAGAFRYF